MLGPSGKRHAAPRGAHRSWSATATCLAAAILAALFLSITPAAANADFRAFVESLWPDAQAARVTRPTFDRAFRAVTPDLTIPDLILPGRDPSSGGGQAEFTRAPQDYVAREQLVRLAAQGRTLAAEHSRTLDAVERQLRVDRHAVLAIWGRAP